MSTCPKCKSAAIYGPAHVQTPNGLVHITVPKSGIFITDAPVKAYICSNCGYIEFFTTEEGLKKVRDYLASLAGK
ncbi:MAG: hypothetical protein K9W42_01695 [Candidatus Heimdallarchaeota archaeon]|nr:hypothetical protein [Candidatus Heimdallarchaeota archaeon]